MTLYSIYTRLIKLQNPITRKKHTNITYTKTLSYLLSKCPFWIVHFSIWTFPRLNAVLDPISLQIFSRHSIRKSPFHAFYCNKIHQHTLIHRAKCRHHYHGTCCLWSCQSTFCHLRIETILDPTLCHISISLCKKFLSQPMCTFPIHVLSH